MLLTENFIWFIFFLIAFVLIYGYRIINTKALKALVNSKSVQTRSNPKALKELQDEIQKDPPSFLNTFVGVFFSVGVVFALYKYSEWYRINTIAKFQSIATSAMQSDCTTHCSVYSITQSKLIGPQLERDCCYGKYSHPDYIFTWESNNPKVVLKEHVGNFGAIASWLGTRVQNNTTSNILPTLNAATDNKPTKLTRSDMESVIQQNQPIINAAYHHALKVTPSMHGSRITIHLLIDPTGHVTNDNVISTDVNSLELRASLLHIFRNLQFSSGNFKTMNYIYNLELRK